MRSTSSRLAMTFVLALGPAAGQDDDEDEPLPAPVSLGGAVREHSAVFGRGVLVDRVAPAREGLRSGLEVGDVVLRVGGVPTPDYESFEGVLATHSRGEKVSVGILRAGRILDLEVEFSPPVDDVLPPPLEFPEDLREADFERLAGIVLRIHAAGGDLEGAGDLVDRLAAFRSLLLSSLVDAVDREEFERTERLLDALGREVDAAFVLARAGVRTPIHLCQEHQSDLVAEIDRWISRLGSSDFGEREEAALALGKAGECAIGRLIEASASEDPEVASRAASALESIRRRLDSGAWPAGGTGLVLLTLEVRAVGEERLETVVRSGLEAPPCQEEIEFAVLRGGKPAGAVRARRRQAASWAIDPETHGEIRAGDLLAAFLRAATGR